MDSTATRSITKKDRKKIYNAVVRNNRRAKRMGKITRLSCSALRVWFSQQGGMCSICGEPLGDDYTFDHIIPMIAGGENVVSNLSLVHMKCNLKKGGRILKRQIVSCGLAHLILHRGSEMSENFAYEEHRDSLKQIGQGIISEGHVIKSSSQQPISAGTAAILLEESMIEIAGLLSELKRLRDKIYLESLEE